MLITLDQALSLYNLADIKMNKANLRQHCAKWDARNDCEVIWAGQGGYSRHVVPDGQGGTRHKFRTLVCLHQIKMDIVNRQQRLYRSASQFQRTRPIPMAMLKQLAA